LTLSLSVLPYVVGVTTTHEAWTRLAARFGIRTKNHELTLRKRLLHIKKGNLSMQNYLKEFKIMIDQLLAYGVKIGEEELQTYILNGPPTFDIFCVSVRTKGVPMTLTKLESLLICEESNRNEKLTE
jgi:hypothetical protein